MVPMEALPKIDLEEFRKVVTSRRSVRIFDQTPIPEQVIHDCLDLALLAPNSSNLQPWEFYWVRSADKKSQLVEACYSQPAAKTAAELIVCVARTDTWQTNANKMLDFFSQHQLKVSQATWDYYAHELPKEYANANMLVWSVKSSCLAAENLMLALRAHTFDSCAMEGFDPAQVSKILNLSPQAYVTMIIAAGKRAPHGVYGPRIRFERENFIKEV